MLFFGMFVFFIFFYLCRLVRCVMWFYVSVMFFSTFFEGLFFVVLDRTWFCYVANAV